MSFIACSGNCKYQCDGYCQLERVSDWTGPVQGYDCLYYASKEKTANDGGLVENSRNSVSYIAN